MYKEDEVYYGIEQEDKALSKKRLNEIARELGKTSKEVVAKAQELGFDVKSHASSVDDDSA
ncbi:MAG: translation initiation factor IF-2 N-terminal domain-containing protein, partial [Streptococcus sp.]|nr:translation initiation factor IF-2 N-terminal domain-containing protein [Streptococcus sp.]